MKTLPSVFALHIGLILPICIVFPKQGNAQASYAMDQYLWKNRLLLFFAPSEQDAWWLQHQQLILSNTLEFEERDLLYYSYFLTSGKVQDRLSIPKAYVAQIRQHYKIAKHQRVCLLIGKDGGVKMRKLDSDIAMKDVFALIDAMPMRRQEMRKKY